MNVITSSCNVTAITLQNSATFDQNGSYTFQSGSCSGASTFNTIDVVLSDMDWAFIQGRIDLATSRANTYMSLAPYFITDQNSNFNLPVDGLQAAQFTQNSQRPILVQALGFDLGSGTIGLLFSQGINVNTIVATGISLSFFNTSTETMESFTLTGVANISTFELDSQVGITLLPSEFFPLKLTSSLTGPYLVSIGENSFFNAYNSGNPERLDFDITMIVMDFAQPFLTRFDFDLNAGTITFVFNEPMSTEIDPSMIFLNASSVERTGIEGTQLNNSRLIASENIFTTLTLNITDAVLNTIKVDPDLCTSGDNCFVYLNESSFMDISMNDVITSDSGLQVTNFINDVTSPELVSFSIDLNEGTMVITFSEAIDTDDIDFSGISLTSSSTSNSATLSGAVIAEAQQSNTILVLTLSNDVLGQILVQTGGSPRQLTITSSAVRGYAGNQVVAIPSSTPLAATTFVPDTTPPTLLGFIPGFPEEGQIVLTFSEYVNASTWNGNQFSLTLITIRGLFPYTNFTQGTVTPAFSDILTYTFSSSEYNPPFSDQYATAYYSGSISLLVGDGLVTDLSQNVFVGNSSAFMYRNSSLLPDTTRPVLFTYSLDLDAGELDFTFSEGVIVYVAQNVIIQSDATSTPQQFYRLMQNGTISPTTPFDTIQLTMDDVDINRIKVNQGLATSLSNTYLVLIESFAVDLYSNPFVPAQGVQPTSLIPDSTGPDIDTFELDLSMDMVTLVFSEPVTNVNAGDIDFSQVFISGSSQSSQQQYALTGSVLLSVTELSTRVSASLPTTVVNMIKADLNVCTSSSNCYIFVGQGSVRDISGNAIQASTTGFQSGVFTPDSIGPSLFSFELDLNQGILSLTYSEPLDTSSFNPNGILISGDTFDSGTAVPLSDASINSTMNLNTVLVLDLGFTSLNSLKALYPTGGFTLTSLSTSVTDTAGNNAISIDSTTPLSPTVINTDITPPTVLTFTPGTPTERRLVFVFDEYVNSTTWDATQMSIVLSTSLGDNTYNSFTGTVIASGTSDTLVYSFTTAEFTTSFSNQYSDAYNDGSISVSALAGLVSDFNRNDLSAISPPLRFTNDRTRPTLISYTLDLNMDTLDMVFSEAVSIISVAGRARLQNSATNPITIYDFVQNGTIQAASASSSIRLSLGGLDLNNIKANTSIATSVQDTYLVLQDNFARDISGNLLIGASQNGIQASSFTPDSTRPTLLMSGIEIDLNAGSLRLQFSEPIAMTFDASQMFLTSESISAPGGYNLTDSTVISTTDQSTSITLSIAAPALDMIKSDVDVCTSRTNCLLFLTMTSFSDVSGNPLQPSATSTLVSSFIPDTTSPALLSYVVDLNAGLLTLSFSEPINVPTFTTFGIQLQGQTQSSGSSVRLSGSTISQMLEYNSVLILSFTPMILNSVKQLATSGGLGLVMQSLTATDTAGNMIVPFSSSNPLTPSDIIGDSTPPSLISFIPGYPYERQLTLVFDEYVNPSTFNANRMTLTLTTSLGPFPYSNIQGTTSSNVSTTVVVMIPESMFVPPFSDQYDKAYFEGTVLFRADPGLISDLGNNALAEITTLSYRNSSLPSDVVPPVLLNYVLDLNTGSILMTFSENIEIVTVAGQATFQDAASEPTMVYNIMQNVSVSPSFASDVVTVTLNTSDVNGLKLNPSLATSIDNTYLVLLSRFVMDTTGNFIADDQNGIRATSVIPDAQGPSVATFDLDLDSNMMTLTFDEPVRISTFDPTRITLTNTSNLSFTNRTSVQLMNVEVVAMPGSILTSFRFILRINDTINVKSAPVCYDASNCYALFGAGLISDVSNNPSPSATSTALQVVNLFQDVTPPRLTAFRQFDLNSGLFVLIFSEPVNVSSTDYTDIQFINAAMSPTINISLTEGFTTPDHIEIDFHLSRNDLNIIKDTPGLCTSMSNCFISLPSFFITDIGMNPFLHQNYEPQAVSGIHQPLVFVPDTTPPVLESYALDMNVGTMMITFSEVVQMQTFNPGGLTFFNATNGSESLKLSDQSQYTFSGVDDMVSITFTDTNFSLLKARDLCSSMTDTFLAAQMKLLDTSDNLFVNTTSRNATQVNTFVTDTTNPILSSFDLFNIDNGSFIITFSEPVELSSVQLTLITFLAQPNSQMSYTLTGGQVEYINELKRSLLVTLSMTDRVQIKLVTGLAVSQASTYVSLGQGMCTDRFNNPVMAVSMSQPIMLTGQYILDLSEASLQSFSLDMNLGQIMLTFNDVISAASVDVTTLMIQNNRMLSDASYTLTLSSLSTVISSSSNVITIMIQGNDLNTLKLNLNLATNNSNTFISFPSGFASSLEGNEVIAVSMNNSVGVRTFTTDMTRPQLSSFDLDMNLGVLTLTFNEPVLVSTANPIRLSFTNGISTSARQVPLNGGQVHTAEMTSISVQISIINDDLNTLKSSTILATSSANTFLSVGGNFISDTSGNPIQAEIVPSSGFIFDMTPPELLYFDANLTDTGKLTLQFSEAVSLLNGAQASIALTNSTSNRSTTLPLSTSSITEPFLGVVEISLVSTLINRLLIDTTIATSTSNLYLTISTGGISDFNSNNIVPLTVTQAQRVRYLCKFVAKKIVVSTLKQ